MIAKLIDPETVARALAKAVHELAPKFADPWDEMPDEGKTVLIAAIKSVVCDPAKLHVSALHQARDALSGVPTDAMISEEVNVLRAINEALGEVA